MVGLHICAWCALLVRPGPVLWLDVANPLLRDHRLHDLFPPPHMAFELSRVFRSSRVGNLRPPLVS